MTPRFDLDRFRVEYRRAVRDVSRFVTPERQEIIARHNRGLEPARTDLATYLEASEVRCTRAFGLFGRHLSQIGAGDRALEVGGFLGVYPLTLARLGFQVTLAEVYAYYSGALDELVRFLTSEGIEILDVDFTQPLGEELTGTFTMVTNMAMLEHLAESPEQLMRNLRAATDGSGALVIDVPNIAYWPNRLRLLKGQTVHPSLDDVFKSASPFTGHHREYTVAEVEDLLQWSGFHTLAVDQFNYSFSLRGRRLVDLLNVGTARILPAMLFRNCREVIMALAVPRSTGVETGGQPAW